LTDDGYFSIVPPIMERLLSMQNDPSMRVRAKAQSVFRACVEQMEMYKDTSAYQGAVRTVVEAAMGPWLASLNQSFAMDVTALSGNEYTDAVKLIRSSYKVLSLSSQSVGILMADTVIVRQSLSIRVTTSSQPPPSHNPLHPG
jgi:hypothetical protein